MKKQLHIFSKTFVVGIAFVMLATGCTKKRVAALPDSEVVNTFAISNFDSPAGQNFSMKTGSEKADLNSIESSKAENESGKSFVEDSTVPKNLKFMFEDLQVSGQTNQTYSLAFTVDRKFVTAYKIVKNLNELSALEKQYAKLSDEIKTSKLLQRARNKAEKQKLFAQLQKATEMRVLGKPTSKISTYYVPIFKYEVTGYGVLERSRNELREQTSVLKLTNTDWVNATHIQIKALRDNSAPVSIAADQQEKLDRTFATSRLNNKIMTAGDLRNIYQVPTGLNNTDVILTGLDEDGLGLYQLTQKSKLSETQLNNLNSKNNSDKIFECSDSIKARIADTHPEIAKECVMIFRYQVPVSYVHLKLPVSDADGNEGATIQFDEVNYTDSVGLVSIPQNVQPKQVQTDDIYDSYSMVRIMDVKDKEFFFRRTLEDAPLTTTFMPGEAGFVDVVKFELQDKNLIVRRADQLIKHESGNNIQDNEDLMSIPVVYIRREFKDSRGNSLATPRYKTTNKENAEYMVLNWANNALPATNSPVAYYGGGSCIAGTSDTVIQDVDSRMDKGVLSFSFQYTAAMRLSEECLGVYSSAGDYNPFDKQFQSNVRLKERVSFKLNDHSTDKGFVPQTPFRVQNALGYGVWTNGKITPDQHGLVGREGNQVNLPVVHDFRNGKVLKYTLTGLENLDAGRRQLNLETTREIIKAWNDAYKVAFKGTSLERAGNYLELEVSGENGVKAHLGDLDRNIIHFENKKNDNHGTLGVSQVGFNHRSGIVVADSLIVFAGNLEKYVASLRRNLAISNEYEDLLEEFKKEALKGLEEQQKKQQETQKATTPEGTTAGAQGLVMSGATAKLSAKSTSALSMTKLNMNELVRSYKQRQSLGSSTFKFGTSEIESAYIERVIRKLIQSSDISNQDVEGLIAQEMLKSMGSKLSSQDKAALQRRASLMNARNQMKSQFATKPGCLLTDRDTLGRSFTDGSFEEAYKRALYFDLGHEMGHSQGLTHNFIASFDKRNYKHSDDDKAADLYSKIDSLQTSMMAGTLSDDDAKNAGASVAAMSAEIKSMQTNNYSSIMDYIDPPQLKWDGIGSYDSRALRASHLGLIELSAAAIKQLQANPKLASMVQNEKFMSVANIQKVFAPNGWTNFTKASVEGLIRDYKYCTDIDVGYEPVCQRFDLGSTSEEIVDNLIKDYNENYVNSYYSWNRLNFGYEEKSRAVGGSMRTMLSMRQFLDETFYNAIVDKNRLSQIDNARASQKAYIFLNQLIRTGDAKSQFLSKDRFIAIPYKDAAGKPAVEIAETRALQDLSVSKERLDTIGIENDKLIALQLLTLKGLPHSKYASNTIEFSYVDFEKYMLGMEPKEALVADTVKSLFLNDLQPTYTNLEKGLGFVAVPGATAEVSSSMRAYAGITAILGLESSTLDDKDNYANMFKVGSTVGAAPSDRVALSLLGVSNKSSARVSFWALDNASIADSILKEANNLNYLIQNTETIQPLILALASPQVKLAVNTATAKNPQDAEALKAQIVAAQAALVAKLNELNQKNEITYEGIDKQFAKIEAQVGFIGYINNELLKMAFQSIAKNSKASLEGLETEVDKITKRMPLLAIAQAALIQALGEVKELPLSEVLSDAISGTQNTTRYGLIMKNVEFMNRLTQMTNPEYSR